MCPLRYIVFAVSALVALVVLVWGSGGESEEDKLKAKLMAAEGKAEEKRDTSIVDFFSGRYLYDKWRAYRGSPVAA